MELPVQNNVFEDLSEIPENLKWLYETEGLSVAEGVKNSGGVGIYLFSLRLFLDTIDENVKIIDKAYKNGDFNVYRVKNGIIRNSARIIGAVSLYDLTLKLEEAFKHDDKIYIASNTDKLIAEYTAFKEKLARLAEGAQNV